MDVYNVCVCVCVDGNYMFVVVVWLGVCMASFSGNTALGFPSVCVHVGGKV